MEEHFKVYSAVFPIIIKRYEGQMQVLLSMRKNTGYMDGRWDFAGSGHVDKNESAKQAVARECLEELGIIVKQDNIHFAHLSHRVGRNGERTYFDIYFTVDSFIGEPFIAEPEKCSELQWFAIDRLPDEIIEIRKQALQLYLEAVPYDEVITGNTEEHSCCRKD